MTTTADSAPVSVAPVTSVDVAVAVLTEKVTQVIGDHERRISALENKNDNRPTRTASMSSPVIAGVAVLIALSDKINWS